ncbi:MAG: hypothetical protein FWD78_07685 [Treponema sp.]|nr:hypothetical protein [Treponema sp.]
MNPKIHLIGNAHIDIFWLWPWEEGLQEIRSTFASALDRINEHNEFIFTSACAYYYKLVEETDPGLFNRIREAVKAERWRITGGWWLQPDCNAPSGESFARHGLYGQRYFLEKFGVMAGTGYNVDSFGHNGNLPQILKKSGLKNYVFMRPGPHEKTLPASLFQWEGIDGSRVPAFRIQTSYTTGGDWGKLLVQKIESHINAAQNEGTPLMCFYGVGNHGGGPTIQNLASIDELKAAGKNICYSDPDKYFDELSSAGAFSGTASLQIPVVKDELQYHAIGCYSALSRVKRANNLAEQQLLFAEKMLAGIGGFVDGGIADADRAAGGANQAACYAELAAGWQKVLANQFHDSLGGCSIPEAYPKILAAYSWVHETVNQMTTVLFQRLTSQIQTPPDGVTVAVWNPHPWEVKQTIEIIGVARAVFDSCGNEIPFDIAPTNAVIRDSYSLMMRINVCLPPLGYTCLKLADLNVNLDPGSLVKYQYSRTASNIIKCGDWEAVIDKESGFITSFKNSKSNTEYLGSGGICPVIVDDESDTWTHLLPSYSGAVHKMNLVSYTLVCEGKISTEYEIVYKLYDSTVILRVILNGGYGTLDIRARIIWNEKHRLLKLRVGSSFINKTFISEIPYGAIERRADGTEWPIQRWARLGGAAGPGLGVINDGIYSASAEDGRLDLTLLRSPIYSHHEPQHPRPDIQHRYIDQGEAEFLVRLKPCPAGTGNDVLTRAALELNQKPVFVIESPHKGSLPAQQSFCRIKNEKQTSAYISTIKRCEDNDGWIIRAVEASGINTAAEIDFIRPGVSGTFNFTPYEIKTIKITDGDKSVIETNITEMCGQ